MTIDPHTDPDGTAPLPEVTPTVTGAPDSPGIQYTPGAIIAGRYRVVALLGHGGMGQVYRADDLKLGQPVALKFLSPSRAANPRYTTLLINEVRVGRQISHPNVCRIYDIVEYAGHHFIAMEYVDGEDLASLIRRVGRITPAKAVQVARELCAGLAAAHEQRVVHRDLKPSNVMIDGRGRARITDLGLAIHTGQEDADLGGTPAYMAPEQLRGEPASPKSDLYSLGLVLYEVFTGRRAFDATTPSHAVALQIAGVRPPLPSSIVPDIDRSVERLILQSTDYDPAARPASARAMLLSLPGGDPLQAAVAAGETPDPDVVAAAESGELSHRAAWGWLFVLLSSVAALIVLARDTVISSYLQPSKPAAVLLERAREVIQRFGYTEEPLDSGHGLVHYGSYYVSYIQKHDQSTTRWERLRKARSPSGSFWYRHSRAPLVPINRNGVLGFADPPIHRPGMVNIVLDGAGRLASFQAVPPFVPPKSATPPDWSVLLREAGLEIDKLRPIEATWTPPVYADAVRGWEGVAPDHPEMALQFVAATHRGKLVYFDTIYPWITPWDGAPRPVAAPVALQRGLMGFAIAAVVIAGVLLARRNLLYGRGDRAGAYKLAIFVFVCWMVSWALQAHHQRDIWRENALLVVAVGLALFWAFLIWVVYIAIEPFVRRWWPQLLVGWTRLLRGRFRDPRVASEVLIGCSAAIVLNALDDLRYLAPLAFGRPSDRPRFPWVVDVREFVAELFRAQYDAIVFVLAAMLILVVLRAVLRRDGLAFGILAVLLIFYLTPPDNPINIAFAAVMAALGIAVFLRSGLLAAATIMSVSFILAASPISLHSFGSQPAATASLVLILFLAICSFHFALAGRPILGRVLFQPEATARS